MTSMRGFDAAQRAWENMEPPESGPTECPDCNGCGHILREETDGGYEVELQCENCDGKGWLDANGEPFDPHEAQRKADEHADWLREERRLG